MGARAKFGLVAAGLMTLAVLAGCSQQEPGTPTASAGETPGSSAASRPTTTSSSGTASADKIEPCSLFPDADATKLGLATPGRARTSGGIPECRWMASGQFGVLISSANKGLASLNGETVTLPKHKAVQVIDLEDFKGCSIAMEVSSTLTVFAIVSPVDNTPGAQMCPRALEVAKVVDSRLP